MSLAETPFNEIHSIAMAMAVIMDGVAERKMVNDTPQNHAAATFVGATQWMLIELSQAALDDRLLDRVIELQHELQALRAHLQNAPRQTH